MNTKKTTIYKVGPPGPGLGQAKECGRVKPLMGAQSFLLMNWISNGNTYINKQCKTCTDSLPLKKTAFYDKTLPLCYELVVSSRLIIVFTIGIFRQEEL